MEGWVVRDTGSPWDVFDWSQAPEPSHEAMRELTVDIVGLRPRQADEPPLSSYVFIDVLAAALATPDITMATGEYPVPILRPYVSGQEAVGIVVDTSPDLAQWMGKRAMGFTPQPFGSFAAKSVLMPPVLYEVPPELSDEEAAGFVIPAHTAYHAVHRRGNVQPGETVLVLGAAGGVPSSALQLCAAAGCHVIAVAGGSEKVAFCKSLGANLVIDHTQEDFVAAILRETGASAVDAIIDFVQGEPGQRARPLLAVEGRHVLAGHAGGLLPIHPNEFYLQNWTLVGTCMGNGYGLKGVELEEVAHAHVRGLLSEGRYRATTTRVIQMDEVPEALRDIRERRTLGRVIARR
ncbi:MAG: zinc-binding dehydrogenase [Myxococcota bacterium]|nr:zinc-binding dehydrogenase [Myxococcota bacterium]